MIPPVWVRVWWDKCCVTPSSADVSFAAVVVIITIFTSPISSVQVQ